MLVTDIGDIFTSMLVTKTLTNSRIFAYFKIFLKIGK